MSRVTERINLSPEDLVPIKDALRYLIETEERHYLEHMFNSIDPLPPVALENGDVFLDKAFYDKPEVKHIYAVARRAKDIIESKSVRP